MISTLLWILHCFVIFCADLNVYPNEMWSRDLVYSRQQLIELRTTRLTSGLTAEVCDTVKSMKLCRTRGCRAGRRVRLRRRRMFMLTPGTPSVGLENDVIPVITGNRPWNGNPVTSYLHDRKASCCVQRQLSSVRSVDCITIQSPTTVGNLMPLHLPSTSSPTCVLGDDAAAAVAADGLTSLSTFLPHGSPPLSVSHSSPTSPSGLRQSTTDTFDALPTTPASDVSVEDDLTRLNLSSQRLSDLSLQLPFDLSTISPVTVKSMLSAPSPLTIGTLSHSNSSPSPSGSIEYIEQTSPPLNLQKNNRFTFPKVWVANIRGGFCNKIDEIAAILTANHIDIAVITESWLHAGISTELTNTPGYTCYRRDRSDGRNGGGVVFLVKNSIPCTEHVDMLDPQLEVLWLSCRWSTMPRDVTHILFGGLYHPPDANDFEMLNYLISCMDCFSRKHPAVGIILCGDFNRMCDSQLRNYPLKQLVLSPTRAQATLDKIYSNIDHWYNQPIILPSVGNSDHDSVLFVPKDKPPKCKGHNITSLTRSSDPNGKALLYEALRGFNWINLYRLSTCQEMVDYFYTVLYTMIDYFLPMIPVKRFSADRPWVTPRFRETVKQRQRAFLSGNRSEYCRLRNRVQRMSKKLRQRFYENKVNSLYNVDAHSWWTKIKQFLTPPKTQSDTFSQLNCPSGAFLADVLNKAFVSVSVDLPPVDINVLTDAVVSDYSDEFTIYPEEVEAYLSRLNAYKAAGPDEISSRFLKEHAAVLCEPVAALLNASVREGFVPTVWKSAEVIPVPKIHPPRLIESDLRPISLLPVLAKTLEYFVRQWVLNKLEATFDPNQFGCLKKRSTTHALVSVLHLWQSALDKGDSVRALFVDFSKAFDRVNHNILLHKLRLRGIPGFLLKWFYSFLAERRQRVRVHGTRSGWLDLMGSIPQGSLLGLLLFLLLVDDLNTDCSIHKFVDDTTLTEILRQSQSLMQQYFYALTEWTRDNDMVINSEKTKEMIMGRIDASGLLPLCTERGQIERVHSFKLLGVYVDETLTWNCHIDYITTKASKRLYFLKVLKRSGLSEHSLKHFYTAAIRPILEYCSVAWGHNLSKKQSSQLESIQKRAIRIIYQDTRNMPYDSLLCHSDITSLQTRRSQQAKNFFTSILDKSSCLYHLLPQQRDDDVTCRLRSAFKLPVPFVRTNKFQSFINYGLRWYQ